MDVEEPVSQEAEKVVEQDILQRADPDDASKRDDPGEGPASESKGRRKERDASNIAQREAGRSLFPITRVQKILKADKELPIIAKEAVFAISIATEEFIKQVCSASQKQAEREKRSTVQRKDMVTVSKRADEFWFLEDVLPLEDEEKPAPVKRKEPVQKTAVVGLMDSYVTSSTKTPTEANDKEVVNNNAS